MQVTLRRRMLNGLGANVYNQGVTVVVQLVGVPILLHAWGPHLYGEWLILFAVPAYLSMTDLGFSQSAGNDMTARVAQGDRQGALAVFQSLGVLVWALAAGGLALSAVVISYLPLEDWFSFRQMDGSASRWVLWLLVAATFVGLPDGVNHAGFRASGDYALHIGLNSTTRLLQFAGIWIAALAGGGPVVAAAAFLGVRAVTTPAFATLLVRRHRWLRFGIAHASKVELRPLLRPAVANTAMPLAQALNIQGMVLVVGAILGPLAVVVFSTLRTLTRLALQLVLVVSNATEPELAAAYGSANRALFQSLFVHMQRAGLWLELVAATVLAALGGVILEVWTHGRVAMEPALFAGLLGSAVASVLWSGGLSALKAANRHLRAATVFVAASAGAVGAAALLLTWTDNIATTGLALLLMDVTMAAYTLRAAGRLLDVRPATSLAQALDPRPLINLVTSSRRLH